MTALIITMNVLEKILFFLSAPKCVHCGAGLTIKESALCEKCRAEYELFKERNCSLCGKMLYHCSCSTKFLDSHFIHKHIKVFRYKPGEENPANTLIYRLKRVKRSDIVRFLADDLTKAISASITVDSNTIITAVPRRKSERAKYGMDHAALLGRAVAKRLSVRYQDLLISKAKIAQKKATNKEERIKNAEFKLKRENLDLSGKTVIIVDDIVTTGASIGGAAFNIKTLTPKKIYGASVAIAYKDDYKPFLTDDRFGK